MLGREFFLDRWAACIKKKKKGKAKDFDFHLFPKHNFVDCIVL
jgi:hypothetical protein